MKSKFGIFCTGALIATLGALVIILFPVSAARQRLQAATSGPIRVNLLPQLAMIIENLVIAEGGEYSTALRVPRVEFRDPVFHFPLKIGFEEANLYGPSLTLGAIPMKPPASQDDFGRAAQILCETPVIKVRFGSIPSLRLPFFDLDGAVDSIVADLSCFPKPVMRRAEGYLRLRNGLDFKLTGNTISFLPDGRLEVDQLKAENNSGRIVFSGAFVPGVGATTGTVEGTLSQEQIRIGLSHIVDPGILRELLIQIFGGAEWSFDGWISKADNLVGGTYRFTTLKSAVGSLLVDGLLPLYGSRTASTVRIDSLALPDAEWIRPWIFSKGLGRFGGTIRGSFRYDAYAGDGGLGWRKDLRLEGAIDPSSLKILRATGSPAETILQVVSGKVLFWTRNDRASLTFDRLAMTTVGVPAEVTSAKVETAGGDITEFQIKGHAFGGSLEGFLDAQSRSPQVELRNPDLDALFRFIGVNGQPVTASSGSLVVGTFEKDSDGLHDPRWRLTVVGGGKLRNVDLRSGLASEKCLIDFPQGVQNLFAKPEQLPSEIGFEEFQINLGSVNPSRIGDVETRIGVLKFKGDLVKGGGNRWIARGEWSVVEGERDREIVCSG